MTDAHWWPVWSASSRRRNRSDYPPPPAAPASSLVQGSSDEELARQLNDADEAALAELYRRFGRLGYSLARRICADDGLAEDVVHEAFLTLWRDPRRFDPSHGSFATWLITLIHHSAVDEARRQGTVRRGRGAAPEEIEEWLLPLAAGAGQAAIPRVAASQVRAALDRLPGEQRQVLVGTYFGGHTVHEIAAVTGVPLGTVKSRLFDGVQRLRSLLTDRLGPDALVAEARAGWKVSR